MANQILIRFTAIFFCLLAVDVAFCAKIKKGETGNLLEHASSIFAELVIDRIHREMNDTPIAPQLNFSTEASPYNSTVDKDYIKDFSIVVRDYVENFLKGIYGNETSPQVNQVAKRNFPLNNLGKSDVAETAKNALDGAIQFIGKLVEKFIKKVLTDVVEHD